MTSSSRVVLITGGSRGLGRNAALALAADGADIVITYRAQAEAAAEVVQQVQALGRRAQALPLDVADSAVFPDFAVRLRDALQAWGADTLQGLMNNAGEGLYAPITDTTEAQFDHAVAVHLKGPYFLTQALLPLIADGGRILNVSSGLARFSLPGSSAYAMMKGGIEVFSRYLAKELGARGISANTLAPGAIETDLAVAGCATTRRSMRWCRRSPRWVVPAGPMTSVRWWWRCCRRPRAGSTASAWKPPVACLSDRRRYRGAA